MNKTYHKFLIAFTIFVVFGGVYLYFSNSLKSEASLISSLASSAPEDLTSTDQKITNDIAFISTLSSLNNIKIDTSLFTNLSFVSLKDNTVLLEEDIISGRVNPFAPVGANVTNSSSGASSSLVKTNSPIEVESRSAIFSGTVNNANGPVNGYFEYGITKDLNQKISQNTVSLIGTFITNITVLESKTTYFYRACAKINGVSACGNIVSFVTK